MANIDGLGNYLVSPQSIQSASANTSVARTSLNPTVTTGAVRLIAKATNPAGALVRKVSLKPADTCTQTAHYLFRSPDEGTTLYFIADAVTPAWTKSNTTVSPNTDFGFTVSSPLYLEANDELWCGSAVALGAGFIWDAVYEAYSVKP